MYKLLIIPILIPLILIGCAPGIMRTPAHLNETNQKQHERIIIFTDDVVIKLSSGYSRKIQRGQKWRFIGMINKGNVFEPIDTVFTIEGAHVREAHIVILNYQLIGFYIPGENSFSPQVISIPLPIHAEDK